MINYYNKVRINHVRSLVNVAMISSEILNIYDQMGCKFSLKFLKVFKFMINVHDHLYVNIY